ncbi:unnamed protein product [Boreogadus saida]
MALLEDHAYGRIQRERVFSDHNDFLINNDVHVQRLEHMVVFMYSKSCGSSHADETRHHLFSNGAKSFENLPPTQAGLIQHIKRAPLQASFYWNQATVVQQDIPEFNAWGWYRDSTSKTWEPYRTNLGNASKACTILLHCGCRKNVEGTASAVKPEFVALLYGQ